MLLDFLFKGGTFAIVPKNITQNYIYIKSKYKAKCQRKPLCMFSTAAVINALPYIMKDHFSIKWIIELLEDTHNQAEKRNELDLLHEISSTLLINYLFIDSNGRFEFPLIVDIVENKKAQLIRKNIGLTLAKKTCPPRLQQHVDNFMKNEMFLEYRKQIPDLTEPRIFL